LEERFLLISERKINAYNCWFRENFFSLFWSRDKWWQDKDYRFVRFERRSFPYGWERLEIIIEKPSSRHPELGSMLPPSVREVCLTCLGIIGINMSEADRKTAVTLHRSTLRRLAELKAYPRQSYEEVILKLLEVFYSMFWFPIWGFFKLYKGN